MACIAHETSGRAALEAAGALPHACKIMARSKDSKVACSVLTVFMEQMCAGAHTPSRTRALVDGGMGALLVAAGKQHGFNLSTVLGRLGLDSEGKVRR
jgi:hypothetical protein